MMVAIASVLWGAFLFSLMAAAVRAAGGHFLAVSRCLLVIRLPRDLGEPTVRVSYPPSVWWLRMELCRFGLDAVLVVRFPRGQRTAVLHSAFADQRPWLEERMSGHCPPRFQCVVDALWHAAVAELAEWSGEQRSLREAA